MEETNISKPKRSHKTPKNLYTKPLLQVAVVVALVGAGFYGGVAYQKSKQPVASTNANQFGGGTVNGGSSFRQRSRDTVTATSSSSITVKTSSGASKTYSISSSTQVLKDGQQAAVSDIATGDSVLVMSSDGTTADRIITGQMMAPGGTNTNMPSLDQDQSSL